MKSKKSLPELLASKVLTPKPAMPTPDLEAALREKVSPLLEESMEKHLGVTIPKIESDITDRLKNPVLNMYIPFHLPFAKAKDAFKAEFLKRELRHHLGNVSQLAKVLGLDRRSIHRAIRGLDIDVKKVRHTLESPFEQYETAIDKTIRGTMEQYRELLQPGKMAQFYEGVPELSRNIARFLPPPQLSWKEAEKEFERQFLMSALREHGGKITETARKIKIRPETLSRKVRRLGLR